MLFKTKTLILSLVYGILLTVSFIFCILFLLNRVQEPEAQNTTMIFIIIISAILLSLFILLLYRIINNFMRSLKYSSIILENILSGSGNLDSKVTFKQKNEAGKFIIFFNEFLKNTKDLVSAIRIAATNNVQAGNKQSEILETVLKAIDKISHYINIMKNQSILLADNITSSSNSIENITVTIKELMDNISDQSKTVMNTSDLIFNMKNTIADVAKIAQSKKTITDNLGRITVKEEERLEETNKLIGNISKSIDDMLEMIEIINSISAQTNLLSMNASIEAAQAGEYGKGFAVVADEIGKLADSTGEKAKDISASLKTLIKNIGLALESSKESERSFKNINSEVNNVIETLNEIYSITDNLLNSAKEVTDSSNSLKTITNGIDNKSSIMLNKINEINRSVISIRNSSGKSLYEIDQIKHETQEINSSVVEIAHYTIENNNSIYELNKKAFQYANIEEDTLSLDASTKNLMQFMMTNVQNIGKRIFFIYPPRIINSDNMIKELIKRGFEVYMIKDHINLHKILNKYNNSVIFINIDEIMEEFKWENYIKNIINNPETKEVRVGIISNTENNKIKSKYLMELNIQCGFIKLTENIEDNLKLLNTIFEANEIKGRRKYLRAGIEEDDKCKFEIQEDNTEYTGKILDISIAGMRCNFSDNTRFIINKFFKKISLDLNGLNINTGGEIVMHHEDTNSYVIMFDNIQESQYYDDLISFIYNSLQNKIDKILNE